MQNTFDFVVIIVSVFFSIALLYVVLCRLEIKKWIKYGFIMIIFCCAYGVVTHTQKQNIMHIRIAEFKQAFYNNETLVCMQNNTEVHINKENFVYFEELGTFSSKDSTKDLSLKGVNIPILSCRQHIVTYDSNFIND